MFWIEIRSGDSEFVNATGLNKVKDELIYGKTLSEYSEFFGENVRKHRIWIHCVDSDVYYSRNELSMLRGLKIAQGRFIHASKSAFKGHIVDFTA